MKLAERSDCLLIIALSRSMHLIDMCLVYFVVLGEGRQENWRDCFNVTRFLCLGHLSARTVNGSSSIFKDFRKKGI